MWLSGVAGLLLPALLPALLLALLPLAGAIDRKLTGVVGQTAPNVVGGVETGFQYDTLHNAAAAGLSGDTIFVSPGQWAGIQDATVLETKILYIKSTGGPLVTSLRGSNGVLDETRVTTMTTCAALTMPTMPASGQACAAPSEYALNMRASSGAAFITVEIEGFTIHNFGFSGVQYFTDGKHMIQDLVMGFFEPSACDPSATQQSSPRLDCQGCF